MPTLAAPVLPWLPFADGWGARGPGGAVFDMGMLAGTDVVTCCVWDAPCAGAYVELLDACWASARLASPQPTLPLAVAGRCDAIPAGATGAATAAVGKATWETPVRARACARAGTLTRPAVLACAVWATCCTSRARICCCAAAATVPVEGIATALAAGAAITAADGSPMLEARFFACARFAVAAAAAYFLE